MPAERGFGSEFGMVVDLTCLTRDRIRATLARLDAWGASEEEARAMLGGISAYRLARTRRGLPGHVTRDLETRLDLIAEIAGDGRALFGRDRTGWIDIVLKAMGRRTAREMLRDCSILDAETLRWHFAAISRA